MIRTTVAYRIQHRAAEVNDMTRPAVAMPKSSFMLPWAAKIAMIIGLLLLLWLVAFTSNVGWFPNINEASGGAFPGSSVGKPASTASSTRALVSCGRCGIVESSRKVITSRPGATGGAVLLALLGLQAGAGGRGSDIAIMAGAFSGKQAGNAVENKAQTGALSEIIVRMEDGSVNLVRDQYPTLWNAGDRVKVVNGVLRRN